MNAVTKNGALYPHRKPFEEAVRYLEEQGETYKAEYARELIETGTATGATLLLQLWRLYRHVRGAPSRKHRRST